MEFEKRWIERAYDFTAGLRKNICLRLKQFVSGKCVADWTGDETGAGARKLCEGGL
jgi:hypothetical protein